MLDKLKGAFGNLSIERFKGKLGGVPIWVWGIVLGLIVGIALYIYRKKNPGATAEGESADGVASLFDQAEAEQVSATANQASYAAGLADAVVGGSGTSAVAGNGSGGYSSSYGGGGGGGIYSGGQAAPASPATPALKVGLQTSGVSKSVFAGVGGGSGAYAVPGPRNVNTDDNPFNDTSSPLYFGDMGRSVGGTVAKDVSSPSKVTDGGDIGSTKTMIAAAPVAVAAAAPAKVIPKATAKKGVTVAAPKKGITGTSSGSVKKGI